MKQHIFTGSAAALITPFSEDTGKIDLREFEKLIGFQMEHKTDALVVAGTTGESPVLTNEEKNELFAAAVSLAGKKIPVIAGTGSNNTEEAVRKSNEAEKKGVDGLLIVTPFYNKCTQDGLLKHYFYIADRVSAPIIVYNVPSRTGMGIEPETYRELAKHKNIAAVKEADTDMTRFMNTMSLCGNSLDFYSGSDELTAMMMSQGAVGVISVAANIIPGIMHKLTLNALAGRTNEAAYLQQKYLDLMNALFCEVNPIPVKAAWEIMTGTSMPLRLPLTEISEKNRQKVLEAMRKAKLI